MNDLEKILEENENKPNYYAIITSDVRYDKDLSSSEKLMYGEISALTQAQGYCWATNNYFAQLYNVDKVTVSRWINKLRDKGYIIVEMEYADNSRQIVKRKIWIRNPMSNVSISNAPTSSEEPVKETKPVKEEKYKDEIKIIIDYLNEKTGSKYRYNTESTNRLIRAKLNDNYTVDDFKKVIDKKVYEWGNNPNMQPYLRPSTLFGNKFEQYLNQKVYVDPQSRVVSVPWTGEQINDGEIF